MPSSKTSPRTAQALQRVAGLFEAKGWKIQAGEPGSTGLDLVIRRRGKRYGVVLKATSEGRADRVIPLLSQAVLQARAYALHSRGSMPLAVVHVDHAPRALIANVMAFAQEFAAEVAVICLPAPAVQLTLPMAAAPANAKCHHHGKSRNCFKPTQAVSLSTI